MKHLLLSWRQKQHNCSQLTFQFEYTKGEETQIVFFYIVIPFEYNDSTTLFQSVHGLSLVVLHKTAHKKNVRTNSSHSWNSFLVH